MNEITPYVAAIATSLMSGLVSYFTATNKCKTEIKALEQSNKHEIEKLMQQHKTDIKELKLSHEMDMEKTKLIHQHTLEMKKAEQDALNNATMMNAALDIFRNIPQLGEFVLTLLGKQIDNYDFPQILNQESIIPRQTDEN